MVRIFVLAMLSVIFWSCASDPPTVLKDIPSDAPVIRLVNDGLTSDFVMKFHLQANVVLEHDTIIYLQVTDNRQFLMIRAGQFKSELLSARGGNYVTQAEINRRNQQYGKDGWWGTRGVAVESLFPPPTPKLRGEKGLSWFDKNPTNTVTILPPEMRTDDILPKKVSNVEGLIILVEHPFRSYKVGKPSLLYVAPRDYRPTSRPMSHLPARAKLVPPLSLSVEVNTPIELTFTQEVNAVAGATGFGKRWIIRITQETMNITWENKDGSAGGPTTLYSRIVSPPPPPPIDTTPPRVIGGTVTHGAKNVDPVALNANRIEIIFNEEVKGLIELRLEDNTLLRWRGLVSGKRAVLELVAGQELKLATSYIIRIQVSDAAGNKAQFWIEFTTRLKEDKR